MVRSSSPRSLLLIDEFGKGTAPADGIGLVAALLRHLSRAGRKCLFTLHFHEIFRWTRRCCCAVFRRPHPRGWPKRRKGYTFSFKA